MTDINFIIKLFDYLGYQFIDEHTCVHYNELWYHNGNLIIDVNFKFETGEISTIGESVYSKVQNKEFGFRGKMSEYLKRIPQDNLRDFKIKELTNE